MILNRVAAGPVGRRRSCSQFCKVFTLTPIKRAKSACESLVRSRIARIPEDPTSNRRDAFLRPPRIAPPSRTLSSSSSNISAFIPELLLDYLGELRHLPRGQICRRVLRIRIEQQNQISSNRPVVNDAGAPTLAARTNRYANLTYSAATLNDRAETRICRQPQLKRPVIFIAEQSRDLPRKNRSLDQLHLLSIIRHWRIGSRRCRTIGPGRPRSDYISRPRPDITAIPLKIPETNAQKSRKAPSRGCRGGGR